MDTEDLWEEVRSDHAWDRYRVPGARLVPGFGQRPTKVMVVADSPAAVESSHLRPFSGTNGRIIRELMSLADLRPDGEEANCWATYAIKYRPPGINPGIKDVLDAQPHLRNEWKVVGGPPVIVAVGAVAWQCFSYLGSLMLWRGKVTPLKGNRYLWGMLPPSYGVRNPQHQPQIERDWEELGRWLREDAANLP